MKSVIHAAKLDSETQTIAKLRNIKEFSNPYIKTVMG